MTNYLWSVISVSLKVATIATILVIMSATALALFFSESRSKWVKSLELLVYLPMAIPPVALGYGLLLLLGRNSICGRAFHEIFHGDISFTMTGAIIAAYAVSLGIGVRTIRVACERIDRRQIEMAQLLGANQWQIIRYIILPQCGTAMASAGVLVFIRSLSEFGATIVLAGNTLGETRTLALAIWLGMQVPGQERLCLVLVVIAVVTSFVALIIAEILLRANGQ